MFSVNVGLSIILYYFARRGKRHKQGLQARKQQTLQGIYTQLKAPKGTNASVSKKAARVYRKLDEDLESEVLRNFSCPRRQVSSEQGGSKDLQKIT